MTTAECIERAVNAPDLGCPICGRPMSVWIVDENPVHVCSRCDVMSFEIDSPDQLEDFEEMKDGLANDLACVCPSSSPGPKHLKKGNLEIYHCTGTSRIFVVDPTTDLDKIIYGNRDCSMLRDRLKFLGSTYDDLLEKL